MITIKVNVADGASEAIAAVISALTGPQAVELSEQGGLAARNAAVKYHRDFDQSGGWRGKRYLGPGQNDGSDFGSAVASGWNLESFTSGGAVIANDATYYAFKVTGGTITPKRAKALTIPLIQEAKGLKAFEYQERSGHRLFTIKGKNALFERIGAATSGESVIGRVRRRDGSSKSTGAITRTGIRAVYALVKSITMAPWPNAVPPEDDIGKAYTAQYLYSLNEKLKS